MTDCDRQPLSMNQTAELHQASAIVGDQRVGAAFLKAKDLVLSHRGGNLWKLDGEHPAKSATLFGITGLIMAATGGYLIVLGTWQFSSRLLFALLSVTVVGAVLSLATPVVRERLFGDGQHPGLVGSYVYWLGTQWWHPLLVLGALALAVSLIAAAKPRRK